MGDSDNVIRPVFGAKPRSVETPGQQVSMRSEPSDGDVWDGYKQIGPLTENSLLRAQKDLLYLLRNKDHVTSMRDQLERLGDTVFNLADFTPDQHSIQLRQEGLRSLSLEEICDLSEKLNEVQVRMQPSYLGALTLEHTARVDAALSLLKEPGPSA